MARAKAKAIAGDAGDSSPARKQEANSEGAQQKKAKAATQLAVRDAGIQELPGEAMVCLPDSLDSASAASIQELLLARRGSPLVVDAGQVNRVGVQALQVLIAAAQTWRADGQSYKVTNASSELLETIALIGLSADQFMLEGSST